MAVMKALYTTAPGEYGLAELTVPVPGTGEVLIRVGSAGLCANEVRLREGILPVSYPLVPGHQFAGVVEARGPDVDGVELGDRVSAHSYILCGQCTSCRSGGVHDCERFRMLGFSLNGGLAEYCVVPERFLFKLPDHVTIEEGELLENVANALAAVRNAAPVPGERLVVIGTSPIALLALQVAGLWSPTTLVLVGPDSEHLALGERLGASHTVDVDQPNVAERAKEALGGAGADAVIVCAYGASDIDLAIDLVASRGRIVVEGHFDPRVEVTFSPFQLLVSRAVMLRANRGWLTTDYVRALELVSAGMIDAASLITHRFSLDEWEEAFETFVTRRDHAIQVAIKP